MSPNARYWTARRAVASAGPNAIPCRSRGPESNAQIVEIVTEKLITAVTFDPERGYVGTAPELRQPVIVLSLRGLLPGAGGGKRWRASGVGGKKLVEPPQYKSKS